MLSSARVAHSIPFLVVPSGWSECWHLPPFPLEFSIWTLFFMVLSPRRPNGVLIVETAQRQLPRRRQQVWWTSGCFAACVAHNGSWRVFRRTQDPQDRSRFCAARTISPDCQDLPEFFLAARCGPDETKHIVSVGPRDRILLSSGASISCLLEL